MAADIVFTSNDGVDIDTLKLTFSGCTISYAISGGGPSGTLTTGVNEGPLSIGVGETITLTLDTGAWSSVTAFDMRTNSLDGDISQLGVLTGLTSLYIFNTDMFGNASVFASMPSLSTLLAFGLDSLTGSISSLSGLTSMVNLQLYNNPSLTGNLSELSGLTSLVACLLNNTSVTADANCLDTQTSMTSCNVSNCAFTETEMDNLLASLVANEAVGGQDCTLTCNGTNANLSTSALANAHSLDQDGWTITANVPDIVLTSTSDDADNVTPKFTFTGETISYDIEDGASGNFTTTSEETFTVPSTKTITYSTNKFWQGVTQVDMRDDDVSGNVNQFFVLTGLEQFRIHNTSISGDISGWTLPSGLTYFYAYNTSVSGDISGWTLPSGLVYFTISSTSVSGDISGWTLPSGLVYFTISSTSVSGDISGWTLPSGLTNFNIYNTSVSGDISGWTLPSGLVSFYANSTSVSGDISGWTLPSGLVSFYASSTSVSGDISGWTLPSGLVAFYIYSTSVTYGTGGAFTGLTASLTGKVDIDNCGLSEAEVGRILADCVSCGVSGLTIELAGDNATASLAGLGDAATLVADGWTVSANTPTSVTISDGDGLVDFRDATENIDDDITVALGASIADLSATEADWTPIGSSGTPYNGEFDGAGYSIGGLAITENANYKGLFGVTGTSANIHDLGVAGSIATTGDWVGGIVGKNQGAMTECKCSVTVSGGDYVGGAIGLNTSATGVVADCYHETGTVTGNDKVGGFVGSNESSATIDTSYANSGTVTGNTNVGGFCGSDTGGGITDAYWNKTTTGLSTDNSLGPELVTNGGFANWTGDDPDNWTVTGESGSDPEVSEVGAAESHGGAGTGACNIYSSSANILLSQTALTAGKLCRLTFNIVVTDGGCTIGSESSGSDIVASLGSSGSKTYDFISTGTVLSFKRGTGTGDDFTLDNVSVKELAVGLTTTEIADGANFTGFDFTGGTAEWYMDYSNPELVAFGPTTFTVTNTDDVDVLSSLVNAGGGVLTGISLSTDLDLSGYSSWTAIGTTTNPMNAAFNGEKNRAYGINIDFGSDGTIGFFGQIGATGSATDFYVEDFTITTTGNDVGGLAAINSGTILRCKADASISASNNVGGLVGENDGSITDSFAYGGDVDGGDAVGGLCGYNNGGTITTSHAAGGAVTGTTNVDGFCGNDSGTITNCYYNETATGQSGDGTGITGLSETEYLDSSSFVGLDFDDVWEIYGAYPQFIDYAHEQYEVFFKANTQDSIIQTTIFYGSI